MYLVFSFVAHYNTIVVLVGGVVAGVTGGGDGTGMASLAVLLQE